MTARAVPAEAGSGRGRWRLLLGSGGPSLASPGAWNMAVDDALLAGVSADPAAPPVLRFYRWDPACLSIGRNQPVAAAFDRNGTSSHGWQVVRRPTGGLAVLHADELTYAVAGSVDDLGRPRAAYAAINQAFAEGLRTLGLEARVVGDREGATDPVGGAEARCFRAAAPGEVSVRGRKILGSAQRRSGRVILQHGSLLLSGSQHAVAVALGQGARAPTESAGTTLAEHLTRVPCDADIIAALSDAFAKRFAVRLARTPLDAAELDLAERARERYSSEAWTWRR